MSTFTVTNVNNLADGPNNITGSGETNTNYTLLSSTSTYDSSIDFDITYSGTTIPHLTGGTELNNNGFVLPNLNFTDGTTAYTGVTGLPTATFTDAGGVTHTNVPIMTAGGDGVQWSNDGVNDELSGFNITGLYYYEGGSFHQAGYVSDGMTIKDATDSYPSASATNTSGGPVTPLQTTTTPPVPCFTADMLIETSKGEVRAIDIQVGDLVRTFSGEFKPVRFALSTRVKSAGKNKPVVFEKGAIGNTAELIVSQNHNFYTGTLDKSALPVLARIYDDHLLHAITLVNGTTIRLSREQGFVTYVHIMLDQHELIYSHGTVSESWHPLRRNLRRYKTDPKTRSELLRLFPEIKHNGPHNTPQVRPYVVNYQFLHNQAEIIRKTFA